MGIAIKNKTYIKIWFLFSVCLLLVACVLSGYFYHREQKNWQSSKEMTISASMDYAAAYLSELIKREQNLSERLQSTSWVVKMSSDTNVFNEQFTPQKIWEISESMVFTSLLNTDVLFRAVYFPHRQKVLHGGGQNSAAYYFKNQGVPEAEMESFLAEIGSAADMKRMLYRAGTYSFQGNIFVLIPVQNTRNPSAYLCSMLNTSVVKEQIKRMLPATFTGFTLKDLENEEVMMEMKTADYRETNLAEKRTVLPELNWEFTFYMDETEGFLSESYMFWIILALVVVLLLVFPFSFLLASYLYRHLEKLFQKLPIDVPTHDMYSDIENNIARLVTVLEASRHETCLRRFLTGSLQEAPQNVKELPDYQCQWVQVFILEEQGTGVSSILDNTPNLHCEFIPEYDGMLVVIASSMNKEVLSMLEERMGGEQSGQCRTFFAGEIHRGYYGISLSFQSAKKRQNTSYFMGIPGYFFPIEMENRLILMLRNGEARGVAAILDQLLDENDRKLQNGEMNESDLFQLSMVLVNDFVRIVLEYNLNHDLLVPLESLYYHSIYDVLGKIKEISTEICTLISLRQKEAAPAGMEIIEYIEKHYAESDLSISSLQEFFHLSANTINKNIRSIVGTTFLPYLTYVRMEKAKELLAAGDLKISEIYKHVGYDMEFSFRRAFSRYSGCPPHAFANPGEEKGENTEVLKK